MDESALDRQQDRKSSGTPPTIGSAHPLVNARRASPFLTVCQWAPTAASETLIGLLAEKPLKGDDYD
jgi:hypothetical protein